jgi:hypothetical protein
MRITSRTWPDPTKPNHTSSELISACLRLVNREWPDGFLWNLVWALCHYRQLQTHTFQFLTLVTTNLILKVVRRDDDDAITHDPLRMRITSRTWPNLTSLELIFACMHLINGLTGRVFMKFGMGVVPL